MRHDKIIILDTSIPYFRCNQIFNRQVAQQFPGAIQAVELHDIARSNGWDMITGDVFLDQSPGFTRAVCMSEEATPELCRILDRGVEPGLLSSGESPNVAWSFYNKLDCLSRGFRHALVFKGAAERVDEGTFCHPLYWPMPEVANFKAVPFEDRKLLAMVASHKKRFDYNPRRLSSRILAPFRWGKIIYYKTADRLSNFPDLYKTRLEAVSAYSNRKEFVLFGQNWDVALNHFSRIKKLNFANMPLRCHNKLETLKYFRFNLAFENCVYPGYVTEKIFDAMQARTVPVYLGAPDIEDFVPRECFVDFRDYSGFDDLWNDISSWNKSKWSQKIDSINYFLSSSMFDRFRAKRVAQNCFEWLTEDL